MKKTVSQKEYALMAGIAKSTVSKAIKGGKSLKGVTSILKVGRSYELTIEDEKIFSIQ